MVTLSNVSKEFVIPCRKRRSLLKSIIGHIKRQNRYKTIRALQKINLHIKRGETIGIIGSNGSGKSTLLRLIAGIYKPTSGTVELSGEVTSVLQLGIGFLPSLSLKENVFLFGTMMGLERNGIHKNFYRIIDFAGVEEFVNAEVRILSLGMRERLAFSIIIHACKDVLLLDEALAVGDQEFKEKYFKIIEKFKKERKTIIFSSHDLGMVKEFCDKALLLNKGEMVAYGSTREIMHRYADGLEQ